MDWALEKKLIFLLLSGIALTVILVAVFYPAEKHEETQAHEQEENDTAIGDKNESLTPEEYTNPLYCNENVKCAAGRTVTDDLLIKNLVTDCVNMYHAANNASRIGCECIEELSMCAAVPIAHMNITGLKNSTYFVDVIVSIPKPDPVFESCYGSLDLIEISGRGENNSWNTIKESEYITCSKLKSPAVEKLRLTIKSTKTHFTAGMYKIIFTYFTDPECKIKRTTEREFTIPG